MKQADLTSQAVLDPTPTLAPSSDEQLVSSTLDGNRDAFEQLVRRHQQGLVNHLYRLTGIRDAAHDLAKEVFIKVYTSLGTFDPRYRFTTWLYRIASNCAIDQRRKKRPLTCSLNQVTDDESGRGPERTVAGDDPDPHDMLRLQELRGELERAIATLPANYRQLILLRHRQHMRYDEIARTADLPLGTVKNRIFRAREMLRRELADFLEGEV